MRIILLKLLILFQVFQNNTQDRNRIRLPLNDQEWEYIVPTSKIDSFDFNPFVETVVDDFLRRKDASHSNVFSIGIWEYKNNISDIIKLDVFPQDSLWRFLLSNADSLGTKEVSISYIRDRFPPIIYYKLLRVKINFRFLFSIF